MFYYKFSYKQIILNTQDLCMTYYFLIKNVKLNEVYVWIKLKNNRIVRSFSSSQINRGLILTLSIHF